MGEYSVRVKDNAHSYTTQARPGYYRGKDREEWLAAAKRAGLTAHARGAGRWTKGWDWYGRPYGIDGSYYELWIEVSTENERDRRQAFQDALNAERGARLDAALAEDRESYNRKETIARYTGML
jgi:hypothetical protein